MGSYEWQENSRFNPWRIGTSSVEQWDTPGSHVLANLGTILEFSKDAWPRLLRRTIPWYSVMRLNGDDWQNKNHQVMTGDLGQVSIGENLQKVGITGKDWSYGLVECISEAGKKLKIWMSRTSPAVLFHSDAESISFFTGEGSAKPRFCAYETNKKARVRRIKGSENMRPNIADASWILVWFGDAFVSSRFSPYVVCHYPADCPLLFFFQNSPKQISLGNGMDVIFKSGEFAGYIAMLPIYGDSYPLAFVEDKKLLERLQSVHFNHGDVPDEFKSYFYPEDFETESWSKGLPDPVLENCRWWAERLRHIPISVRETYEYEGGQVRINENFRFIQLKEGGTMLSPVPPMLAIAREEGFPVQFSDPVVNTSLLTAHGPFAGLEGVKEYSWEVSGLGKYLDLERKARANNKAPQQLYDELEMEVEKVVNSGEMAPWYPVMDDDGAGYMGFYDRGYRGYFLFSNPEENCYFLAESYPFLKPETQEKVLTYLKVLRVMHQPGNSDFLMFGQGFPRERYGPTPRSIVDRLNSHFRQCNFHIRNGISFDKSLYYLSRYYDLTGNADILKENWGGILNILSPYLSSMDWGTMGFYRRPTTWNCRAGAGGVMDINTFFSALIGGIRLAKMTDDTDTEQMLWGVFAKTAALRFAMGKYYSYLNKNGLIQWPEDKDWMRRVLAGSWKGYLYTGNWSGFQDDIQQIWQMDQFGVCYREDRLQAWPGIMTFMDPSPELGLFFKDYLLSESKALMRRVNEAMPAWWTIYCPCEQTWETSFQPPEDAYQLFMLNAWVLDEKPEKLAWLSNVSWLAQGDMFYIHKLAETIRVYEKS